MITPLRHVFPRLIALPGALLPFVRVKVERIASKRRPSFAPNIVAAVLCAIVAIAFAGSFGQLVFDGALASQMSRGIFAALVSTVVMLIWLPWRGAYVFSVGGPDSNPSAVLAVTLAAIAQAVATTRGAGSRELVPTVLAYMSLSAIGCGVMIWLLGARRGGRAMRYLPYPVVGGFLAGSGYLLVAGAFKVLTGQRLTLASLAAISHVNPLAGATTLAVAALLVVLTRRLQHYLVVPAVIIGAVLAFHAMRAVLGIDLAAARSQGLLLPALEAGAWPGLGGISPADVRWDLLLRHIEDFVAMTAVVVVTAMMNTSSLEIATGRDGDADRELRAIGLSNVLAGLLGGMVASNSFNRTILNLRAGANSAWSTRICAALIGSVMIFAPGIVGLLPRPVLTGVILYLGITLLMTWVVDARRTLTKLDYAAVLAILGIIATKGIVSGVVLGVMIACVSFAVTMSRNPNVRHAFTGESIRSNVERSAAQLACLRERGRAVRGFVLDGVLFFGTARHLLEEIRRSLADTRIVVLDFRLIRGIDGSAIVAIKRVHALCRETSVQLVLTALPARFEALLARGGFDFSAPHVKQFADLDRGLECCEGVLLGGSDAVAPSLAETLGATLTPAGARLLLDACERRLTTAGSPLVRQGEASNEMFFLERGRVHVLLRLAAGERTPAKRLRTYGPGTIVGEMSFYSGSPRSADIVAEEDTETRCLTRERLDAIEKTQPEIGRALHRHVILTMAQRLRAANDEIGELL